MSRISKSKRAAILQARRAYKFEKEYQQACSVVNKKIQRADELTPPPWCKPESTTVWNGEFTNPLRASAPNPARAPRLAGTGRI